jgi:FkbM family methyltransferase
MAKLAGPTGAVHAFEPAPPAMARLRKHVERNRLASIVHTHAIALSDQTGSCEMTFADVSQDNQGLGSIVDAGAKPGSMKTTVETMTLDDFVAEHSIRKLDLMKVDIQGAEVKLLEGGQRTFTELSPDLLMEISPEDLACMGKTSADLCRLIESYGYRIHHLTKSGTIGARIDASQVPPHFAATNVYCTKKLT